MLALSVGFTYDFIGVNLSLGSNNGALNVKLYPPIPSLVRPYAYSGVSMILGYLISGVGVGVDMNLGSRVIFQPSVGLNFNYQRKILPVLWRFYLKFKCFLCFARRYFSMLFS